MIKKIKFAFLFSLITICNGSDLIAQHDHVQFRFSNLIIDEKKEFLSVDIEVKTNHLDKSLYAINSRFFYEADILEYKEVSDFKKGYDFIHLSNKPVIGDKDSAKKMFGLEGSAGYLNLGLELVDFSQAESWKPESWEKLVTIDFLIKREFGAGNKEICPSFIWDRSLDSKKTGFLIGSVGVSASAFDKNMHNEIQCNDENCLYQNFNWELNAFSRPFGNRAILHCLNSSNEESGELLNGNDFFVEQNVPNPFIRNTLIHFYLPEHSKATLSIFDVSGNLITERTEEFDSGLRFFNVNGQELATKAYYYTVSTEKYKSENKIMIKIQ